MTLIGVGPDIGTFRPAMQAVGGPPLDVTRIFCQTEGWGSGEWPDVVSEIAAGRVPIVSTKLSQPWLSVSMGSDNARLDVIVNALSAIDVSHLPLRPRLSFHHEPEGDGSPADYNAMWKFLVARYGAKLRASGWAFCVIIMGRTLIRQTKWTPEQLDQALAGVDVTGVFADIYDKRGVASGSPWATKPFQPPSDPKSPFTVYLDWCKLHGYNPALTEYSVGRLLNDLTGTDRAAAIESMAQWPRSAEFEFICAYNRNAEASSIGNWSFEKEPAAMTAFGHIYDAAVPVPTDCEEIEAELAALKVEHAALEGQLVSVTAQRDTLATSLAAVSEERDTALDRIAAHPPI